jgi:small subunit ribosomal protein S17
MTDIQQETAAAPTQTRTFRKVRVGRVVSDRMDKTVVVQISHRKSHPLYKKVVQRRERFKAHDETNECKVGDLVRIMETRPLSKEKHWRVVEVVEKAR